MKNKTITKNITTIILIVLFVLCVTLVFKSVKAHRENKLMYIFNHSYSVVPTPSMEPVIKTNDIIIVKDVAFEEIKKDDIIVFFSEVEGIFIVHRVIDIYDDGSFHTKGDNNQASDNDPAPSDGYKGVTKELYLGKVVKSTHLLGLGFLLVNLKSVLLLVVIIIFIIILVTEVLKVVKTIKHKDEIKNSEEEDIEKVKERLRLEVLAELEKEKNKSE